MDKWKQAAFVSIVLCGSVSPAYAVPTLSMECVNPKLIVKFTSNQQEPSGGGLAFSEKVQFDLNYGVGHPGTINLDPQNPGTCRIIIDQGYRIYNVEGIVASNGTHPPGLDNSVSVSFHSLSFEETEVLVKTSSGQQGNVTYIFNVHYRAVK